MKKKKAFREDTPESEPEPPRLDLIPALRYERREESLSRRRERIEKDIALCEARLHRRDRLQEKAELFQKEISEIEKMKERFLRRSATSARFPTISRREFLSARPGNLIDEIAEFLAREREEILANLGRNDGLRSRLENLARERLTALDGRPRAPFPSVREDPETTAPRQGNGGRGPEDLLDGDGAIRSLERSVGYLKRCKNWMILGAAKDRQPPPGSILSSLRWSDTGRALEMAAEAERNLRLAKVNFLISAGPSRKVPSFPRVLENLLEAVYGDLCTTGVLRSSLEVLDRATSRVQRLLERARASSP